MQILQIILIALFAYLGSIGSPWIVGLTGGWYTLGRPLVASMIVGLILGDIPTALAIGITLQAMYIGVITPGAVLPFDVNYAGYLVPALIIMAKANPSIAATLAVPVAMIGVLLWNLTWVLNVIFVHRADKYAEEGNLKGMKICNVGGGQALNFICRFVPAFLILLFGSTMLEGFIAAIPAGVQSYLAVVSGMLPALGIGLLLNMIIKDKSFIGLFIVGFVLATYLKLPIIAIAIIGSVIAVFYYKIASAGAKKEDETNG